jgi:hypothetical protein
MWTRSLPVTSFPVMQLPVTSFPVMQLPVIQLPVAHAHAITSGTTSLHHLK